MNKPKFNGGQIASIEALAKCLSIDVSFIYKAMSDNTKLYSTFEQLKSNGKLRALADPQKSLKITQRRINSRIFSKIAFPLYLMGSIKDDNNKRDFVRNAELHKNALAVFSFDINDFFPSIKRGSVINIFKHFFKFPQNVAENLAALTTNGNHLPQGAPTSPIIANLVFHNSEHHLVKWCQTKGFTYSRLIDDIVISSPKPVSPDIKKEVHKKIKQMLGEDFSINHKKTKFKLTTTPGEHVKVTGIVINKGKLSLSREQVKKMKNDLYDLKCTHDDSKYESTYHAKHESLSGVIALYRRVNDNDGSILRREMRKILPKYNKEQIKKLLHRCIKHVDKYKNDMGARKKEWYIKRFYQIRNRIAILSRTDKKMAYILYLKLNQAAPLAKKRDFYV